MHPQDIEQLLNIHSLATAGPSHLLQNLWTLVAAARSALPQAPGKPSPPPAAVSQKQGVGGSGRAMPFYSAVGDQQEDEEEEVPGMTEEEVQAMFADALFAAEQSPSGRPGAGGGGIASDVLQPVPATIKSLARWAATRTAGRLRRKRSVRDAGCHFLAKILTFPSSASLLRFRPLPPLPLPHLYFHPLPPVPPAPVSSPRMCLAPTDLAQT